MIRSLGRAAPAVRRGLPRGLPRALRRGLRRSARLPRTGLVLGGLVLVSPAPVAADELRVEIAGVRGAVEDNVRAFLSIARAADGEPTAARIRRLHDDAPEEIRRALEPFGYYRPTVEGSLERRDGTWTARYEIAPGPPLRVSSVELRVAGAGAGDAVFRRLVREFPLEEGDVLDHAAYEEAKEAFAEEASQEGFLDAEFTTAAIRIDRREYDSRIELVYDTGPQYRFGEVTFYQEILEDEVLEGYLADIDRGDPLSVDRLLGLQQTLGSSPYFASVEVLPRPELAEGMEVPVHVRLVPAARQKYEAGVGYGTDTGPRGQAGLDLRRINRRGHQGRVETLVSGVEQSVTGSYRIPGAYPRTDVLTFSAGYAAFDTETSETDTALLGAALTRSRGRWRESFGLRFTREDFEVGVDRGTSELVVPSASWSRVRADDRLLPKHGERLELSVRAAEAELLSDSSFVQVRAEGEAIRSLGTGVRALGRLALGWTGTDEFRTLPPSVRFFAGGDQSVRGYEYQSLGRRDREGNVIGGETLLEASVEVDWLFIDRWGRWGLAAFYDVGSAARDLAEDLRQGIGAGVRWLSPVGLVRADVAWALDAEGPGTPVRFHLTIGPDL
ncbi:MAG: autotransporter assembly complex protein TamA [Thermoanaerobaculia bacterium]